MEPSTVVGLIVLIVWIPCTVAALATIWIIVSQFHEGSNATDKFNVVKV